MLLLVPTLLAPVALGLPLASGSTHAPAPSLEVEAAPRSADLPREYVAADATLVAHLDLANLRRSRVGQLLLSQRAELDFDELDELEKELGIDLYEEIHSVTVYGTGSDPEPSAVVLVASDEMDRVIAKLSQEEGFGQESRDGFELFRLEDTYAWVAKLRGGDRVVVIGEDPAAVVSAARVVRGETPSLADRSETGLEIAPLAGSFLFLAANEFGEDFGSEPASQVFGLAQGIQFDVGEAGDSLFLHLAMRTGSLEEARDVVSVLQGLLAIARLAGAEEMPPRARDLLAGLRVSNRAETVSIDLEYAVAALAELLAELREE